MTIENKSSEAPTSVASELVRLSKDDRGIAPTFLRPMLSLVADQKELTARGVMFEEDSDDFDLMDIARFRVQDIQACLAIYRHSSPNRVMVFVDTLGCSKAKASEMVVARNFVEELGLSDLTVDWTNPAFNNS